ncbi:MAG TPA: hypothetical protein ENF15_03765 [Candidatus Acetothermia bacterium]|nr:hypothetical protein [Candidatus Acetothermia bacterium]
MAEEIVAKVEELLSPYVGRSTELIQALHRVQEETGARLGGTSPDGLFDIQPVRCLGACGLAPVIMIDGEVHGKLDPNRVRRLIARYREGA